MYNGRKTHQIGVSSFDVTFDRDNRDQVVFFVTESDAVINLPHPCGFQAQILVKKMSNSGTVTVQAPEGITIDGNSNYTLSEQFKFVELLSAGDDSWAVVGY
jgi:hypothetical protein